MFDVAVVTDSTHYAPSDLLDASGVDVVSLYVNRDGRPQRETDIIDIDVFYDRLRTMDSLPTTSQPSIGDFLHVFSRHAEAGRDIVSIHLASGISGTCDSARQAAQDILVAHPERRIEIVDSGTACGGLALCALAAAAAARGGGDVDAVVARARAAADELRLWFAVETLEYLRRGGRIGTAQAWVGGALRIKPILSIAGEITPVERVRTSTRAFERMLHYLSARHADGADGWVVQHIQAAEQAQRLVERGREIFGCEPAFVGEVGPVIGAHVGPGLLGVGGIRRSLLDGVL